MKRRIYFLCVVLLFICNSGVLFAADTDNAIQITATVEEKEFHVGDRIELTLIVENAKDFEVLLPDKPENLGDFTFIEVHPIEAKWPRKPKVGRQYILSIYETGNHVIPPIQVNYKSAEEIDWKTAESPQVPIEVKSLLTGDDKDIKDLKGLIMYGSELWKMILIMTAIFIFILLLLGVWLWKKKIIFIGGGKRKKTAYEIAYEQLKELQRLDLPGKGLVKEYYTKLSDIIRHYLEDRFSFRAPEMTTEEFMEAIKNSSKLIKGHKETLKEFLVHCDMVKFAKYGPTPLEMLDVFHAAERLVDQTRLEDEKEAEE